MTPIIQLLHNIKQMVFTLRKIVLIIYQSYIIIKKF